MNEKELRLRNFSPQLKKDLKNVSTSLGIPMSNFAKTAIRSAVDAHLKKDK
jgi:hypothetical protein